MFYFCLKRKRKSDLQNGYPCKKLLPESKTGCSTTSLRNKTCSFLSRDNKPMRAVIPTKDNPTPEMANWLAQFQVLFYNFFSAFLQKNLFIAMVKCRTYTRNQ